MPYKPILSNETALTSAVQGLTRDVSESQSATSGQINGTLRALRQTISAMPVSAMSQNRRTGIPGWTSGTVTLTSTSLVVPAGKTRADIVAFASGLINIDGVASEGVTVSAVINGVGTTCGIAWSGGSMGTDFVITGTGLASLNVIGGQTISVRLNVNATTRPIIGTNWGGIAALGVFS